MPTFNPLRGRVYLETQQAVRAIATLTTSVGGLRTALTGAGAAMASFAAAGVIGAAVREAAKLDKAIREVATLLPVTVEELDGVKKALIELSTQVPDPPEILSEALYRAVSAGARDLSDAMQIVEASARLGVAGLTTTAQATQTVSVALNAFGKSGEDAAAVADVFFRTVERGVLKFPEIAQNFGTFATVASQVGLSVEEATAAFAAITQQGFNPAESATRLNRALLAFVKQSKEASEVAEALGIDFSSLGLESRGLVETLKQIDLATEGNIDTLAKLFPRLRALTGVAALLSEQGFKNLTNNMEAMRDATGAVQAAFEKNIEAMDAQVALLKGEFRKILLDLGEIFLPLVIDAIKATRAAVSSLADIVRVAVEEFKQLPEPVQRVTAAMIAMYAILGPLTVALNLLAAAAGSSALAGGLTAVAGWLGAALRLIGPVGLALTGLAAWFGLVANEVSQALGPLQEFNTEMERLSEVDVSKLGGEALNEFRTNVQRNLEDLYQAIKELDFFINQAEIRDQDRVQIPPALVESFGSSSVTLERAKEGAAKLKEEYRALLAQWEASEERLSSLNPAVQELVGGMSGLSDEALKLQERFQDLVHELEVQGTKLIEGAEAARRLELHYMGFSDSMIDTIIRMEKQNELFQLMRDGANAVSEAVKELDKRMRDGNFSLEAGAGQILGAMRELEDVQIIGRNFLQIGADVQDILNRWNIEFEDLPDNVRAFFEPLIQGTKDSTTEAQKLEDKIQDIANLASGILNLANAFGILGDSAGAVNKALSGAIGGFTTGFQAFGLTGGIVGGGVGLLGGLFSGLFGGGPSQAELARRENTIALGRLRDSVDRLDRTFQGTLSGFSGNMQRALREFAQIFDAAQIGGNAIVLPDLDRLNITLTDLERAADNAGVSIDEVIKIFRTGEGDMGKAKAQMDGLIEAINEFAASTLSAADAIDRLIRQLDIEDIEDPAERFTRILDATLSGIGGKIEAVFRPLLENLDLTTAEGRRQAEELIRTLFDFSDPTLTGLTGAFTSEELERIVANLDQILDQIRSEAGETPDGKQGFTVSRSITAVQANLLNAGVTTLIAVGDQQLQTQRDIRDGILSLVQVFGAGGTSTVLSPSVVPGSALSPSVVPGGDVNLYVTVEAGTDMRQAAREFVDTALPLIDVGLRQRRRRSMEDQGFTRTTNPDSPILE